MAADERTPPARAVALRYAPERSGAPRVTASGSGRTADRIIALAREAGVDLVEDPDLLEVLARVPVGEQIPAELFQAVAEILAFVYRVSRRFGGAEEGP